MTPLAARTGAGPLLAVRMLLGLAEGVAFPATHSIISRCVPAPLQSRAVACVTAASYAGAALAFAVAPPLIDRYGWPAAFDVFGGATPPTERKPDSNPDLEHPTGAALLWLPLWLRIRVESTAVAPPASSPPLSLPLSQPLSPPSSPPSSLLASFGALLPLLGRREVLALCATQYFSSFGLYALISWLPSYFHDVFGTELSDLPALTVGPYILQALVGVAAGAAADAALARGVPKGSVRKAAQLGGSLLPAACLVAATSPAVTHGSAACASVLLAAGLGCSALCLAGVSANHLDIAPRHAGAVFGAGNTAATFAGLVAVPATGLVLDASRDASGAGNWSLVFCIIAAHCCLSGLIFIAFAGEMPLPEDDRD